MRLRIASTSAAALGIAALSAGTGAWPDQPEAYAFSYDNAQVQFFDCSYFGMNFTILADWTYNEFGRNHYDKDGNIVKVNGFFFNTDRRAYNSTDPSKAIEDGVNMVGAPEHQHFMIRFDDDGVAVYYKESGINFKAVVPGYGSIVLNAGNVVFQWIDGRWVQTKFTPNRGGPVEDWYPMCAFLQ